MRRVTPRKIGWGPKIRLPSFFHQFLLPSSFLSPAGNATVFDFFFFLTAKGALIFFFFLLLSVVAAMNIMQLHFRPSKRRKRKWAFFELFCSSLFWQNVAGNGGNGRRWIYRFPLPSSLLLFLILPWGIDATKMRKWPRKDTKKCKKKRTTFIFAEG